jgi:hypothetical protein
MTASLSRPLHAEQSPADISATSCLAGEVNDACAHSHESSRAERRRAAGGCHRNKQGQRQGHGQRKGRGQDKRDRHVTGRKGLPAHGLVRHGQKYATCCVMAQTSVAIGKAECRVRLAALQYDGWVNDERTSRHAFWASAPATPRGRRKGCRDHCATLVLTRIVRAPMIDCARWASEGIPPK